MPYNPTRRQTPEQQALNQERQASLKVRDEAQYQDLVAQQQADQKRRKSALESARKQQVTNAKRAGVQTQIDNQGVEFIKTHDDGTPFYSAGFQGGAHRATLDGKETDAFNYRDARGQRYTIPSSAIRREPNKVGGFDYLFDATGPDGTKQTIRQPEDSAKPLFQIDEATGQRLVETIDPETGSVNRRPIGYDPTAATAAAIERRKKAFEERKNALTMEADAIRAQQDLDKANLAPIKQKLDEAETALKEHEKGRKYRQKGDGLYYVDTINGKEYESPIADDATKAQALQWIERKKSLDEQLAKSRAEFDPLDKGIMEAEIQRKRLAQQIIAEGHAAQRQQQEIADAAKKGVAVWQPEFEKRLDSAMKDPRFTRTMTEGQLEDEGNPALADATRTPASEILGDLQRPMLDVPEFGTMVDVPDKGQFTDALSKPLDDWKPATAEQVELAAFLDSAPNAPRLPDGTLDAPKAAQAFGVDRPEDYAIAPSSVEGRQELIRKETGETIAFIDPENGRMSVTGMEMLRDSGRALLRRADESTAPIYFSGLNNPLSPAQRRDYFTTAFNAARMGDEAALTAAKADIPGIREQVRRGQISMQDGRFLMQSLHGIDEVDASPEGANKALSAYIAGSEIEKALWSGPKATPDTRAQVVNRFMDGFARRAQGSILFDGTELGQTRAALLGQHAGKSLAKKAGHWVADTATMLAGSMAGLAVNAVSSAVEGNLEAYSLGRYKGSERYELFKSNTAEWMQQTAGFARRVREDLKLQKAVADVRNWATNADPGAELPGDLLDALADTAYTVYHGLSGDRDERNGIVTSRDTFDPRKDPVLAEYFGRFLETRNPQDFEAFANYMGMDGASRALSERVQKYISSPKAATAGLVADRAKAAGLDLSNAQAQTLLDIANAKLETPQQFKNAMKRAQAITGLSENDAALAIQLFTGQNERDPASFMGYTRAAMQAGAQEIVTEAASTALSAGFGKLAARGVVAAAKGTTVAATRRATVFAWAGSKAAALAEDFERLGMFKAKFGQPLTGMQRVSNAAVAAGKGVVADSASEAVEEGVVGLGEAGSNLDTVVEAGLSGAAAAPIMIGGMAALSLPSELRARSRENTEWAKRKQDALDNLNESIATIPGAKPFTPEEFEQALMLYGSPQAEAANADVDRARAELEAAHAEVAKLFDGSGDTAAIVDDRFAKPASTAAAGTQPAQATQEQPAQTSTEATGQAQEVQAVDDGTPTAQRDFGPTDPNAPAARVAEVPPLQQAQARVISARINLAQAIGAAKAREALAVTAQLELREIPEEQRTLFTAVAKLRMGATEFTQDEATAIMRQSGNSAVQFVPAPTTSRVGPDGQLPEVDTLPGNRMRILPGSAPIIPDGTLAEIAQSAPALHELIATSGSREIAAQQGQQADAAAKAEEQKAPESVEKTIRDTIEKAVSKSPKLKGLVSEADKPPAVRTAGMWTQGRIEFHIPTLVANVQASIPDGDPAKIREFITGLMDEEIRHAAHHEAARRLHAKLAPEADFMAWFEEYYGAMWQNEFTEQQRQAVREAYGEALDQHSDAVKAMEGLRMLSQMGSTKLPGTITEAILEHLEAVLAVLRDLVAKPTKAIREEIDRIRAILEEYGYDVADTVEARKQATTTETEAKVMGEPVSVPGKAISLKLPSELEGAPKRINATLTAVSASQLVTSDNDRFPSAMQPRDRKMQASRKQRGQMENNLRTDPEQWRLYYEGPTTDTGRPVVAPLYENGKQAVDEAGQPLFYVVSGNGRIGALRDAYAGGYADSYQEGIARQLEADGVTMPNVADPVAVAVYQPASAQEAVAVATGSNIKGSGGVELSDTELAGIAAEAIQNQGLLKYWNPDEQGNSLAEGNHPFMRRMNEAVGGDAWDQTNDRPNKDTAKLARNAMLAMLLGNSQAGKAALRLAIDSADLLGMTRQLDGIAAEAGNLMRLAQSRPAYDLIEELAEALQALIQFKEQGSDGTAVQEDFLRAMPSPAATAFARALMGARSARAVREMLQAYRQAAEAVDTTTPDMFGASPPTKADLLDVALDARPPEQVLADFRAEVGEDHPTAKKFEAGMKAIRAMPPAQRRHFVRALDLEADRHAAGVPTALEYQKPLNGSLNPLEAGVQRWLDSFSVTEATEYWNRLMANAPKGENAAQAIRAELSQGQAPLAAAAPGRGALRDDYNAVFKKQKSALTRAQNASDWDKVIALADEFDAYYSAPDAPPFPDDWMRWQRAKEDAQLALRRGGQYRMQGAAVSRLDPRSQLPTWQDLDPRQQLAALSPGTEQSISEDGIVTFARPRVQFDLFTEKPVEAGRLFGRHEKAKADAIERVKYLESIAADKTKAADVRRNARKAARMLTRDLSQGQGLLFTADEMEGDGNAMLAKLDAFAERAKAQRGTGKGKKKDTGTRDMFAPAEPPAKPIAEMTKAERKAWALSQPEPTLPDRPGDYFTVAGADDFVPVESLVPLRPPEGQEKSVRAAMAYAKAAADGQMDKRKPISVRDNGDGTYSVLDGNATYGMAKKAGWKRLPVKILQRNVAPELRAAIDEAAAVDADYPHAIDGNFRGSWKIATTGRRVRLPEGGEGTVVAIDGKMLSIKMDGNGMTVQASMKSVMVELTENEAVIEPHFIRQWAKAKQAHQQFNDALRSIAGKLPEAYAITAPLKGAPRALSKLAIKRENLLNAAARKKNSRKHRDKAASDARPENLVADLHDIVRGSILVDSINDVTQANSLVVRTFAKNSTRQATQKPGESVWSSEDGTVQVIIADRFDAPTAAGYSDVQFKVRLPSGMLAEIQVHIPEMLLAKEGEQIKEMADVPAKYHPENFTFQGFNPQRAGHLLFEQARELPADDPAVDSLNEEMARLYKAAIQAHQSRIESIKATKADSDISRTSGDSGNGAGPADGNLSIPPSSSGPATNALPPSTTTGTPSSSKNRAPGENREALTTESNQDLRNAQEESASPDLFDSVANPPAEGVESGNDRTGLGQPAPLSGGVSAQGTLELGETTAADDARATQGSSQPRAARPDGTGPGQSGGAGSSVSGRGNGGQGANDGGLAAEPTPAGVGGAGSGSTGGQRGQSQQGGSGTDQRRRKTGGRNAGRDSASVAGLGERRVRPPVDSPERNFQITPDTVLAEGGAKTRARNNIAAIRLLRILQREDRNATPEEKAILAKYVGWGAIPQVFDDQNAKAIERGDIESMRSNIERYSTGHYQYQGWAQAELERLSKEVTKLEGWQKKWGDLHRELKETLTPEEWERAAESTLNAHYTRFDVIQQMWSGVERLGFKGGNVMEPSGGVGHYFGAMPADLADRSRLFGTELDTISGGIFKKLYPEADIEISGFEETSVPDNSLDLAISNVPFGNFGVLDKQIDAQGGPTNPIHNYFFAKALTKVRPGGIVAFITSSHTMDSHIAQRKWLAERAEFLGAMRLPNNAFRGNAGTDVVTDIIYLRKPDGAAVPTQSWTNLADVTLTNGNTLRVNEYFAEHPEMILGDLADDGSMQPGRIEMTVHPRPGANLEAQIAKANLALPKDVIGMDRDAIDAAHAATRKADSMKGGKLGNLAIIDGKVRPMGAPEDTTFDEPKKAAIAKRFIGLRDRLNSLYKLELDPDASDAAVDAARAELNSLYDDFTKRHGLLHEHKDLLSVDPDFYRTLGLEVEVKGEAKGPIAKVLAALKKKKYRKADVFTKRVLTPKREPTTADSPEDAMGISLGWRGKLDSPFMADLVGMDVAEMEESLLKDGLVFRNPATGLIETPETYLSGNVRKKLRIAEQAAESDPRMTANVTALREIQPPDLEWADVGHHLGSQWVPVPVYQAFADHIFGPDTVALEFIEGSGEVVNSRFNVARLGDMTPAITATYATSRRHGIDLLSSALNDQSPLIYDTHVNEDGSKSTRINPEATAEAREVVERMRTEFKEWVDSKPDVQDALLKVYNETFNSFRNADWNGQHLQMPWVSKSFELFPAKKDVVWRAIQQGNMLIAHGVGGGKTIIGTAIALEQKRLGLAKKPLIVVHNATLEQFAGTITQMAPTARVLVAHKADLKGPKRKEFMAKIANGDWDAVVMAHSSFNLIPDDPVYERRIINELIDQLDDAIRNEGGDPNGDPNNRNTDRTVKELQKQKKKLRKKMTELLSRTRDDVLTFQELGIDSMIFDEAHMYKKLPFVTNKNRIAGIDNGASQRGTALMLRSRYIQETNNGRGVFTMTGTPITNTLGEAWNMIRLVRPDLLQEFNIPTFDAFVSAFATVEYSDELRANGKYKRVERLSEFDNLPEFNRLLREAADVKMGDAMDVRNRPGIKGGKPELVALDRTPGVTQFVAEINEVIEWFDALEGKEKREYSHIPLVTYNAAKLAAIDMRLINPTFADEPGSKVNAMIAKAVELYERSSDYKGTQVIFADSFRPLNSSSLTLSSMEMAEQDADSSEDAGPFNLYDEIKRKLVERGVKPEEIVSMQDINSDDARERLFEKVNAGKVRIVIGSTQKLGTGVNMQERMLAAHHLDVPWTPADLEQRDGRLYRQGNVHAEMGIPVEIYRYGMKDTLDAALWQKLETKERFIKQALSGEFDSRKIEDDGGLMTLAEQKAILTGPLGLRKFEIETELRQLETAQRAWQNRVYNAKRNIQSIDSLADQSRQRVRRYEKYAKALAPWKGLGDTTPFNAVINGETLTDPEDIKKALNAIMQERQKFLGSISNPETSETGRSPLATFTVNGVTVTWNVREIRESLADAANQDKRWVPGTYMTLAIDGIELDTGDVGARQEPAAWMLRKMTGGYAMIEQEIGVEKRSIERRMSERKAYAEEAETPQPNRERIEALESEYRDVMRQLEGEPESAPEGPLLRPRQFLPPSNDILAGAAPARDPNVILANLRKIEAKRPLNEIEQEAKLRAERRLGQQFLVDLQSPEFDRRAAEFERFRSQPVPDDGNATQLALMGAAPSRRALGTRLVDLMPKAPDLAGAYQRAREGQGTAFVSIDDLFRQAQADSPGLTQDDFARQIRDMDTRGAIFTEPSNGPSDTAAHGVLLDNGMTAVRVAMPDGPLAGSAPTADPVRAALESMPPLWRDVLEAAMKGDDLASIAKRKNITEAGIGNILRVARGRLNALTGAAKGTVKPTIRQEGGEWRLAKGRPDLALGAIPNFAAIDARRASPVEVTHAEMNELAAQMFDAYEDAAEKLVVHWMDTGNVNFLNMPRGLQTMVQSAEAREAKEMLMTAAAKILVTQKTLKGGDPIQLTRLIDAYRNTGTEQARALGMRYDPHQTPEERAVMFIQEAILTPPESVKEAIRKNPQNKDRLLAKWGLEAQRLKEALKSEGYDIDATFAAFAEEQAAQRATVPQQVRVPLGEADRQTRIIVKTLLEGGTPSQAAMLAGLTNDKARDLYQAFRDKVNQAGTEAAQAMRDRLLGAAPALDFAGSVGLPFADIFDAPNTPAIDTSATQNLNRVRRKPRKAGTLDLSNPVSTARVATMASTHKATMFEKVSEFWRAAILSGPQTHVVNVVSSATFGTYETFFKRLTTGAAADVARLFGAETDAASMADMPAVLAAVFPSIREGWRDALRAWRAESRFFDAYASGQNLTPGGGGNVKADHFNPALKGLTGKVMRSISFRPMLLADEFMKSFFTRVEVAAQARQIARAEGLKGPALANRMAALMRPGSEAWVRGLDTAKAVTFQTEIGEGQRTVDALDGIAKAINKAKKGDFGKLLKGLSHFMFPFVATPTNIFKTGVTMSPLGAGLALIDAARAFDKRRQGNAEEAAKIYNAARAFDDLVNQIVAWGTLYVLSDMVMPGDDENELPSITGSMEWRATSKGEREVAYRTAPPQSIRIGDRWYSYRRLDPFATVLSGIVDAVKEMKKGKPIDEAWAAIGVQVLNGMQDKTFLQGMGDFMNAVQDPERFGTKWATNIATGFLPNLIRQPMRSADPMIRESDMPNDMGFWENIGARVGMGIVPQAYAPHYDVWGNPSQKGTDAGGPTTDTLLRLFSPVDSRDASEPDPLDVALMRYNLTHEEEQFGVAAPSREISRKIGDEQVRVSLNDAEYQEFVQRAGQLARQALGTTFNRELTTEDVKQIKGVISYFQGLERDAAFDRARNARAN